MPFVALQAPQRFHGARASPAEFVGGEITEIPRGQRGGQPQADIGGRSALGHLHPQRQLRIVGRQPVRFRAHQVVEEAPGFPRDSAQKKRLRGAQLFAGAAIGPASQPAHQQRRNRPENHERTKWARIRLPGQKHDRQRDRKTGDRSATAGRSRSWCRCASASRALGGSPFQKLAMADRRR